MGITVLTREECKALNWEQFVQACLKLWPQENNLERALKMRQKGVLEKIMRERIKGQTRHTDEDLVRLVAEGKAEAIAERAARRIMTHRLYYDAWCRLYQELD